MTLRLIYVTGRTQTLTENPPTEEGMAGAFFTNAAYERILRAHCGAIPLHALYACKAALLGAIFRRAMADRLDQNEFPIKMVAKLMAQRRKKRPK